MLLKAQITSWAVVWIRKVAVRIQKGNGDWFVLIEEKGQYLPAITYVLQYIWIYSESLGDPKPSTGVTY